MNKLAIHTEFYGVTFTPLFSIKQSISRLWTTLLEQLDQMTSPLVPLDGDITNPFDLHPKKIEDNSFKIFDS